jgi:hypothetical protein
VSPPEAPYSTFTAPAGLLPMPSNGTPIARSSAPSWLKSAWRFLAAVGCAAVAPWATAGAAGQTPATRMSGSVTVIRRHVHHPPRRAAAVPPDEQQHPRWCCWKTAKRGPLEGEVPGQRCGAQRFSGVFGLVWGAPAGRITCPGTLLKSPIIDSACSQGTPCIMTACRLPRASAWGQPTSGQAGHR